MSREMIKILETGEFLFKFNRMSECITCMFYYEKPGRFYGSYELVDSQYKKSINIKIYRDVKDEEFFL